LNVIYDMGIEEHDNEGRVISLEFEKFFVVNVYTPNSKRGLLRLAYRQEWDRDFLAHLKKLEETKPVILCGDLNAAHKEIDLKNPKSNRLNPGFSDEERQGISNILDSGFIDTFRHFNSDEGHYTWWSYMFNAREKNIGWRIDYFCVSESLSPNLKDAFILKEIMGSDHCPVGILIAH
jgi:exodeoxyribonuclease-3